MTKQQKARVERLTALQALLAQGEPLKRAAWHVGVSYRTARRYNGGRG